MISVLPRIPASPLWRGLRVGLLGGAFNPPHAGHVHVSLMALKALQLDAVWWLVTPYHPFDSKRDIPPLAERLKKCRICVRHPRIFVTDLESALRTSRSYDTVRALTKHFPHTDFVWITGMDNALELHTWYRWKDLMNSVCMAHIARPPALSLIRACPARMLENHTHKTPTRATRPPLKAGTTYWIKHRKMLNMSSQSLRNMKSNSCNTGTPT